jgi:hypothetical protein
MAWDDELEQLVNEVVERHGADAFEAALSSALIRTIGDGRGAVVSDAVTLLPNTRGHGHHFPSGGTITSSSGVVRPIDDLYEAMRIELRRLVRPH